MLQFQGSVTAKLCTFCRALHASFENDKVFDDYLAYDLIGNDGYEAMGSLMADFYHRSLMKTSDKKRRDGYCPELNGCIAPIILPRAHYTEHALERFAKKNTPCQYIICGAGFDTFAFRNHNTSIQIYELDHPDTQRAKLARIKELGWHTSDNVHYVAFDLLDNHLVQEMEKANMDRHMPTFISILGVSYYLSLDIFKQTLLQLAHVTDADCEIVFDYPDETTFQAQCPYRMRYLSEVTAQLGEPMQHGFSSDEISSIVNEIGFDIDEHLTPDDVQKKYFIRRKDGLCAFENIHILKLKRHLSNTQSA